jgi:phospholipid/cholesterol/gamma-HCH transport system permease protein
LFAIAHDVDAIKLDFSQVTRIDTSAIAVIELARRTVVPRIELARMGELEHALFDAFVDQPRTLPIQAPRLPILERIGERILAVGSALRALASLTASTLSLAFATLLRRKRLPTHSVGEQIASMGTDAIVTVGLLSFLVGMSIALQGAVQLRRLGAGSYVGDLVGLSMVRELSPLITALIVTGRTGAAIAAELGTMRAGSEIDALTAMGISPIRYVVVPRLLALVIVVPILTLFAMFVALIGGMVVAELVLRISPTAYWWRLTDRLDLHDFARGLTKSVAFAWIIGLSAAHLGLRARRDASGVGRATTRAVVTAVFWIIVFDAVFESISTLMVRR